MIATPQSLLQKVLDSGQVARRESSGRVWQLGIEGKSDREPREYFGGACVVEARPSQTGSSVPMLPMPRAMPHQSTPGFCFWRDGFVVARRGWTRMEWPAVGAFGSAVASIWLPMYLCRGITLEQVSSPAATTKPSLRPVALRRTSNGLESGHRKSDRPSIHPDASRAACQRGTADVQPARGETTAVRMGIAASWVIWAERRKNQPGAGRKPALSPLGNLFQSIS